MIFAMMFLCMMYLPRRFFATWIVGLLKKDFGIGFMGGEIVED